MTNALGFGAPKLQSTRTAVILFKKSRFDASVTWAIRVIRNIYYTLYYYCQSGSVCFQDLE